MPGFFLPNEEETYYHFFKEIFTMRKNKFLTGLAALALVMTLFAGCQMEGEGVLEEAASRSAGVQVDITNTTWLAQLKPTGVSRLDFTSASAATGVFANTDHTFAYTLDTATGAGTLTEPSTGYSWAFRTDGLTLNFTNGFAPYDTAGTPFQKINIQTSATFADLTGTLWLGRGPRGESYMYNVEYDAGEGTLTGAFGPDSPNEFTFTYTYNSTTKIGSGTMSGGAGGFSTYDSTATMVFPDFWGHGVSVTFNLFVFAQ
jgi:hypothetical protein